MFKQKYLFQGYKSLSSSITIHHAKYSFATLNAKMCYYEVLGVKANATPIELKKAYYDRVKLYHPDHNSTQDAEEQFKIVARAYETLKDPVSRQVYDLGKSNPYYTPNPEETMGGSTEYSRYYNNYSGNAEQKKYEYYNNKWYDYGRTKQQEENIRDEYYNMRNRMAQSSLFDSLIVRAGLVVGLILVYDMYHRWAKKKHNDFVGTQQEILAVGPVIFDSPLVFVREKPIDPVKLQEEMKKKEFRIEYSHSPQKISPEAEHAMKKYKKKKEIVGLEDYIDKRKVKIQKSEDEYHNTY